MEEENEALSCKNNGATVQTLKQENYTNAVFIKTLFIDFDSLKPDENTKTMSIYNLN